MKYVDAPLLLAGFEYWMEFQIDMGAESAKCATVRRPSGDWCVMVFFGALGTWHLPVASRDAAAPTIRRLADVETTQELRHILVGFTQSERTE